MNKTVDSQNISHIGQVYIRFNKFKNYLLAA